MRDASVNVCRGWDAHGPAYPECQRKTDDAEGDEECSHGCLLIVGQKLGRREGRPYDVLHIEP